jgi:predicted extracellular nuclease
VIYHTVLFSQQDGLTAKNSLTVVFYNVENLFDTINNPATSDEEFLPKSPKQWDINRYRKKISDLASVLASVNERELPALIGLAEIENKNVLQDLVATQKLRKVKYGIVHFESKDERGIDVALLYNTEEIELLDSKPVSVSFPNDIQDVTRDILYAKCRIKGDRILHVFVNHWPSRSPSQEESEIKRVMAAVTLRKEVDNILNSDNGAAILILGDFNDEPTNKSLLQILNATNKLKNQNYRDLYNLMYDPHNMKGEGSITYKDEWQMFDQIIVSVPLLQKGNGYYTLPGEGKVFRNNQVLVKDPVSGSQVINRTYSGDKYAGGVSDHLPVYTILRKDSK